MKKKGFTLIELLAVIVVLAIIALIATPIVMNVIKKANEGAAERSADNYLKAVDTLIATEKLDGTPIADGEYTIDSTGKLTKDGNSYEVEVSGTKPVGGTIVIANGQVDKDSSTIDYEDYNVTYKDGIAEANEKGDSISELAEFCDLKDGNEKEVGAKYLCDLGDGDRIFYVLEAGSDSVSNSTLESNQIALILEENYNEEVVRWCMSYSDDGTCAVSKLNAELDDIVENTWTKLDKSQIGIPSIQQVLAADGQDENSYSNYPKLKSLWLYDNLYELNEGPIGYWTSTISNSGVYAYMVDNVGSVADLSIGTDNLFGVRPIKILEA